MSHPAGLPDLFIDRSLGRIKVPRQLRASGLRLTTLAEYYGVPQDQEIADTDWLEVAEHNRWIVFMKDKQVRLNTKERDVVEQFKVRCFCITNANVDATEIVARYLKHLSTIVAVCQHPGPFIYAVQSHRIHRVM